MNLIKEAWLPVSRADGSVQKIAPWQITESENPVVELNAPRPDFQGALYQFLIGLLQTCFAPEDADKWLEYWEKVPEVSELNKRFSVMSEAFELDSSTGPVFLQDFKIDGGEKKPINALLIETPGGKTLKDNLDFFIKRKEGSCFCSACAATALYTLQTNAPSGGVGHRVGIRGGGPLTTLVRPGEQMPLWHKLWLNVLDEESFAKMEESPQPSIFPWLAPTRVSDKNGQATRPADAHPLQVYWGMPRRIRLHFSEDEEQSCSICASTEGPWATGYITRNYGVNYEGEWIHPLTPYRFDPQKKQPPLSLKGQQGGLGYRHWLGLVWTDPYNGDAAAKVTREFVQARGLDVGHRTARLWCFGYDMDNMKARCWYDHTMPLFQLDSAQRDNVIEWVGEMINAARLAANSLRQQFKSAIFSRSEDAKGDLNTILLEFWQKSEPDFYKFLEAISRMPGSKREAPTEVRSLWPGKLFNLALELFDAWVMAAPAEDMEMKRIIAAREELKRKLFKIELLKSWQAQRKTKEAMA